jgi:chitinase
MRRFEQPKFWLLVLALLSGLMVTAPGAEASGRRIVGYFTQWGIYARNYQVSDIPAAKITHINYAFLAIDGATGTVKSNDEWADMQCVFPEANGLPAQTWEESQANLAGNFGRLRQLKALYPRLKTLMSVGGWTLSANFPGVAATPESRQVFVSSCLDLMTEQDFDGIDIDWEFPGPADKHNLTLLMQEFREQLEALGAATDRKYLLTLAAPAGFGVLPNYELGELSQYLDWFNLMGYDFHGSWESQTNHHAPLFMNPNDPADPESREKLNVAWAVQAYLQAGVPPAQLVVGIPCYGRAWEEVPATDHGLFMPGPSVPAPSGPGIWESGMLDYWKIREILATNSAYSRYWDNFAQAPFVYGPNWTPGKTNGGMFVTYEDPESLRGKISYVKKQGLGGIMFWEFSGDIKDSTDPESLLNVIYQNLPVRTPYLPLLLLE